MESQIKTRVMSWRKSKALAIGLSLASVVVIGVVDFATGSEFRMSAFYLLPILPAAWIAGRAAGMWIALACAISGLVCEVASGVKYRQPAIPYWNSLILLIWFWAIAWLVAAFHESREALDRRVDERTASLRDSEGRLKAIVETAVEGIITIDSHGTVESMNPASERIFGYRSEEVIGRNVNMLMPAPYHKEHDGYISHYLKTGEARIIGIGREVEGRRKDGTVFPMALSVSEFALSGERTFVGLVRDITIRKQAEESRNRLAAIVESSNDAIVGKTLDGIITSWNEAAEKLYGYSAAEAIGRPMTVLFAAEHEEEESKILAKVKQGERIADHKTVRVRKNGSLINIAVNVFPVFDQKGNIVGASNIARDITELTRLEAAIIVASEEERNRIARDLHDGLGQQLGGALFLSDLLMRDLKKRGADESARASEVHGLIVNALADIREVSRGLYAVPPEADGLMMALQDLAERVARDRQIECTFDADSAVLLSDRAMATHLYRIAQEAVSNALKHSGAKRIEIKLTSAARSIELSVRDHGTGLPADARTRGLGMQTMSDRASLIGGQLIVQNAEDGGVRLICSLSKSRAMSGTDASKSQDNQQA